MGIYCYGLLVKPHTAKLEDGTPVQVHVLKFLFNGGSFYGPSPLQRAMAARTEKTWEGRTLPQYVMESYDGKSLLHGSVYRFTGRGPLWVDCDKFPGERIGYVNEIQRGVLTVGPCRHQARDPKTSIPPFDTKTGQDICAYCGELFGPENTARAQAYVAELDRRWAEEKAAQEAANKAHMEARARGNAFRNQFQSCEMYKVNVRVETNGWCSNDLRFPTPEAADAYGRELSGKPGVLEVKVEKA